MTKILNCCGITLGNGHSSTAESSPDARVSQNEIGPVYDKLARIYDAWGLLTESRARARAIELAGIMNGQNILEVAVGTGLAFFEIVKRNPRGNNVGIDLSGGMLERAKKRLAKLQGARYTLSRGTSFTLPCAAGSIDLLVNNYMFDLMAFEDMDRVLDEFKRVLKENGKLVLVNMTEGESLWSKVYDLVYRVSPRTMGGCRGVKLSDRLKEHGFNVTTREYHRQWLFPSEVIVAYK